MIETGTALKAAPAAFNLISKMIDSGNAPQDALSSEKQTQYNFFYKLLEENVGDNKKLLMLKFIGEITEDQYNEFDEKVKKDKRENIELIKTLIPTKKKRKVLGLPVSETTES